MSGLKELIGQRRLILFSRKKRRLENFFKLLFFYMRIYCQGRTEGGRLGRNAPSASEIY
jgi:hypothetical protein